MTEQNDTKKCDPSIPNHARVLGRGQVESKNGFSSPRRKWDDRCKFCQGTGRVYGLQGWEDCQGCNSDDATIEQIIEEWKAAEGGMAP